MRSTGICCVVVIFNPDIKELCKTIRSIYQWAQRIIIIDNTPKESYCKEALKNYHVDIVQVRQNIGIGAAQNIGLLKAIDLGFGLVVLSDQDTIYPEDYGILMKGGLGICDDVCAIFPTFVDTHRSNEVTIKATIPSWNGWKKISPPSGVFDLYEGAASGMMLKVACLEKVGLMNEQLFIDWVDFEWCWRARASGFRILGTSDVKVFHSLGVGAKKLGNKVVNIRPPSRHYYIVRNCVYLAIYSNFLNVFIRIRLLFKSLIFIAGYSLLFSPRLVNIYSVIAGFKDGILGRLGKRF